MASTTTNLRLKLLGTSLADKEMYFEEWRQYINGEMQDSNMQIIDRAYHTMSENKVDKADVVTAAQIDAMFMELDNQSGGEVESPVITPDDLATESQIDELFE